MEPAATIDSANPVVQDLHAQLIDMREAKTKDKAVEPEVKEESTVATTESLPKIKKLVFTKGEQKFELDEDAEFEMTADKNSVKMTLRELKERAAGDIAVKNRMHSLAEEKKKVQSTLKDFTTLAKKDPLAALEYISNKAKDSDSEFEYKNYLNALAEQAEKLGKMDEKELKTYELEKKLNKAEQDLSLKQREADVVLRKQELLSEFPEIGDQQFSRMVTEVLENPELSEGVENESDLLDVVDSLIRETVTQRDIITVINEINPKYAKDNDLIFSISDQIRKNPDLEEQDIRDIIAEIIQPNEKAEASRVLSQKRRSSGMVEQQRYEDMSPVELLKMRILEQRELEKSSLR
jgi:hypothetical protein